MESSTRKGEVMKPLLLKAGISLVLSVTGVISARIIARRLETKVSSQATIDSNKKLRDCQERYDHDINSIKHEEHMITSSTESLDISHEEVSSEGELLGLRSRIEELEKRELDLEIQFLQYHVMKEQEPLLLELKNMLALEAAHVEFLDKEITSMQAEKQRFHNLLVEYLRVLEQLEFSKLKNGILGRKVKRISKKMKEKSRLIREKQLKIEATEEEIMRCYDGLETRSSVIKKLEDEVRELQIIVNQQQEEKNEILIKLNAAENSAPSKTKTDEEVVKMEDCKQLMDELEQLRKDRAAEITELIYLRWTNACLSHELMRSREQEQEQEQEQEIEEENKEHLILELDAGGDIRDRELDHQEDGSVLGQSASSIGVATTSSHDHGCSKRKKLLHKLKRWVEGSDQMKPKMDEKEKQEIKCLGRLSVSEEAEEDHMILSRRSCSSA